VARRPSSEAVGPLEKDRLNWIAQQARAVGLAVSVY
jgi:hypothetical protein